MSENLTGLRAFLRTDLGEPSEGRWSDDDLDRHIAHAIRDLNRVAPREMKATDLTIADPASRAIDISSLTDLINVVGVEYPVGASIGSTGSIGSMLSTLPAPPLTNSWRGLLTLSLGVTLCALAIAESTGEASVPTWFLGFAIPVPTEWIGEWLAYWRKRGAV